MQKLCWRFPEKSIIWLYYALHSCFFIYIFFWKSLLLPLRGFIFQFESSRITCCVSLCVRVCVCVWSRMKIYFRNKQNKKLNHARGKQRTKLMQIKTIRELMMWCYEDFSSSHTPLSPSPPPASTQHITCMLVKII